MELSTSSSKTPFFFLDNTEYLGEVYERQGKDIDIHQRASLETGDLRMKKDTEQSAFIKSEKDRERWIISLSVSPATGSPFLCQPAFLMEWRVVGVPNYPGVQSHMYQHPTFFSPFFPLHIPFVLPYPHPPPLYSMPSSVLRIHLQIKQIYHSVIEAGKGGRLWNALALRAGKGSEHSATHPCILPAVPVSSHVFMIHAMPLQPPLPIPVLPVPTKPT